MYDEHNNTDFEAAPEMSPDTTALHSGYFPYDPPAQPDEATPVSRETDTLPDETIRTASRPPQQQTGGGTWYGSSYAAKNGLRTPSGMLQHNTPAAPEPQEPDPPPKSTAPSTAWLDQTDPIPPPPKRKRGGGLRAICLILVCILLGGGAGYLVSQWAISDFEETLADLEATQVVATPTLPSDETPTPTPPPTTPVRTEGAFAAEEIYELGRHQVVGITTEVTTTNIFGQATTGRVSGSGFIVSADGYILTNYHVIEGATRILVMLEDYSMHEAELIGGEGITSDIAVLKIDAAHLNLTAAAIGSSSDMRVGSPVFAIGNPLGELTFTMTTGIISALNREVAVGQGQTLNMFQSDAAVNSGNSGGPMYNEFGEVVGVVTAKAALEGVEGIGFAIPIDDAMRYADQLIERGYIPRPHLGIFPVTVTESYAHYFRTVVGVFVNTVYPNTAAAHGGILEGDIITNLGGRDIRTVEELRSALGHFAPEDTVVVTVFRDGEHLDLNITLGDRPEGD